MVKTGRMSNKINRRKFNLKLIGGIILDQKKQNLGYVKLEKDINIVNLLYS